MPKSRATKPIDSDVERAATFNILHTKLFKKAAEFSILTGARIAIVLESENGQMFTFGSPSAESVVDDFLSGNPCTDFGGEQNAGIMHHAAAELEGDLPGVKEMAKAPEKVGNELAHVHVAPQMPPSHTSLMRLGSSTQGERAGADGGYGHDVGSPGY
ncbi:hypothetical protein QYE76_020048 [Lolium multiflorum]|uniref:MADS-box domain-containing protein n=1 Tax=Lolium multiflorum TaxID=4521 RepID=A0AAD8R5M6_LOLMU|nr:hypothetical protein QYE76_020048 [Lolium multiflorum]